MSITFNRLELRILNWLKDNIEHDIVSFADLLKIVDAKENLSEKYDLDNTLRVLAVEGLINIGFDTKNQQYKPFVITREGLITLRQRH